MSKQPNEPSVPVTVEEALRNAAEIRAKLSDRRHSDSSEEISFQEILSGALSLSPGEREVLVDHLLASLPNPNQEEIDAAWAEEAERRMREIDEGKVQPIDGELVMHTVRARIKK